MTSDADDALSWEGDEDRPPEKVSPDKASNRPALVDGWKAVGKDSDTVGRIETDRTITDSDEPHPLSTPMLLLIGIVGGIYLLYTVGWIIGGMNLQVSALFLVSGVMYHVGVWSAVLAPALWFAAVWLLTRGTAAWVRVLGFLAGVVLLVPWPFVMTGAVGS